MGDTTRLERWVALQKKTWDCDHGARAARITIERGDEVVQGFAADVDELGRALEDALAMQADELTVGAHQFRIVAYGPDGKQLAELPQTVKGRNKDATTAGSAAIASARANHMSVDTMSFVLEKTRQELDQVANRNGDLHDDIQALIGTVNDLRLSNEEMLLRRLEFEEKLQHKAKVYEAIEGAIGQLLVPIGTLLINKYGSSLLGVSKDDLQKVAAALPKTDVETETPKEDEPNVGTIAASEKPTDPVVPVVVEPGQGTLPPDTQGRRTGNRGAIPRKRGPTAPRPKTTKRK